MLDIDRINPATYAERLAGYIADPSTIRARTLENFSHAPSIADIERMRAKRFPVKVERRWPCGHDRVDENTAWLPRDREGCLTCYKAAQAALTAKQRARQEKHAAEKARRDELAAARLKRLQDRKSKGISLAESNLEGQYFTGELISQVAHAFLITPEVLMGESRFMREVCARSVVIRILRERGTLSLPAIGRLLGRDHSTVCHALNTWEKRVKMFPEMQLVYEALR